MSEQAVLLERIVRLEEQVRSLQGALAEAQTSVQNALATADAVKNVRAFLPRTDILSPKYLTRAFAVWGHYFVANLVIAIPLYILFFLCSSFY